MWEADREPDRDEKRERGGEGRLCCVIVLLSLGETYLHMYSVTMAMYQLQTYNTLNSFVSRQHWHPEFKQYDEARHRYVPKGYREPWQRKYGLGRRYSKNAPKVTVPLQDKVI